MTNDAVILTTEMRKMLLQQIEEEEKLSKKEKAALRIKELNNREGVLKEGWVDCPVCKNKRFIYSLGKDFEIVTYSCECQNEIRSMKRIERSGLKDMIGMLRFDNFECEKPYQKVMFEKASQFVSEKNNNWFVVLGCSGAGKTHICTAVCNELLKKGKSLIYLRWAVELKRLKMSVGDESYEREFNKIFSFDVIYLDDIFKRLKNVIPTDGDVKLLFEIIDTSNSLGKTLIISGEDLFKELLNIDTATAGRIKQKAEKYLIEIENDLDKNYRLK